VRYNFELPWREPETSLFFQIPKRLQAGEDLRFSPRVPESKLAAKRRRQRCARTNLAGSKLTSDLSKLRRLGKGFLEGRASRIHAGGILRSAENVQTFLWGMGRACPWSRDLGFLVMTSFLLAFSRALVPVDMGMIRIAMSRLVT